VTTARAWCLWWPRSQRPLRLVLASAGCSQTSGFRRPSLTRRPVLRHSA